MINSANKQSILDSAYKERELFYDIADSVPIQNEMLQILLRRAAADISVLRAYIARNCPEDKNVK